jgi:hypothetical protein
VRLWSPLFLHCKLGGVYGMGRALRARLDLLPYAVRLERVQTS